MATKNGDLSIKNEGRLSTLEANYCNIDKKIETIMTNHLPHIQAAVEKNTEKMEELHKMIDDTIKCKADKEDLKTLDSKVWGVILGLLFAFVGIIANYINK